MDAGVGGAFSGLVLLKAVLDVFREAVSLTEGKMSAFTEERSLNRLEK